MPIDTACCAETVNSAISLWTELEIVDEDDDLFTYHTLDTNSVVKRETPRVVPHHAAGGSVGAHQAPSSCLKRPTIGAAHPNLPPPSVDPSLKWQEEAYWMSFRDAVRSFSDHHCVIRNKVVQAQQEQCRRDDALMLLGDHDHDAFSLEEGHVGQGVGGDYHNVVHHDDGLPPCLPRTVVTPTASIATISQASGEMSVASQTTASRQPLEQQQLRRHGSFGSSSHPAASNHASSDAIGSPMTTGTSAQTSAGTTSADFTVIRRNLRELADGTAAPPPSPGSTLSLSGRGRRIVPRGDWTISESLAGPTAEELKGIRWRMKQLAEQAAAIVKGDKGAEQYVFSSSSSWTGTR